MKKEDYYWKVIHVYAGNGWQIESALGFPNTVDIYGWNHNLDKNVADSIVSLHNKEVDRFFDYFWSEQKSN